MVLSVWCTLLPRSFIYSYPILYWSSPTVSEMPNFEQSLLTNSLSRLSKFSAYTFSMFKYWLLKPALPSRVSTFGGDVRHSEGSSYSASAICCFYSSLACLSCLDLKRFYNVECTCSWARITCVYADVASYCCSSLWSGEASLAVWLLVLSYNNWLWLLGVFPPCGTSPILPLTVPDGQNLCFYLSIGSNCPNAC